MCNSGPGGIVTARPSDGPKVCNHIGNLKTVLAMHWSGAEAREVGGQLPAS